MIIRNEEIRKLSKSVRPWFLHGELKKDAPENIRQDWERLKSEHAKEKEEQIRLCFTNAEA